MLAAYRKRFILSNMLLAGSALFFMLLAVFVYSGYRNKEDLKATMAQLTEPIGGMRTEEERFFPFREEPWPLPPGPEEEAEREKKIYEKNLSIFFYHMDTGELSLLSKSFIPEGESLQKIAREIAAAPEAYGALSEEGLYYYRRKTGPVVKIAVADIGFLRVASIRLSGMLVLIFLCAMLVFYAISRRLASVAVRPLEAAFAMEKQFVADASHDLKTPVAVVLANMGILRGNENVCVRELMQWVDGTKAAAEAMQSLIEEMLLLSDLEAVGAKTEMETVSLSNAVGQIALFLESVAYEKKITYETAIAEDVYVRGNVEYLKRIAQALIENAVKYEPSGGKIMISLSVVRKHATFVVNNRSAVISREDLPYVFERFYRADPSRAKGGGHGLGLAIAKRMTDCMNGRMEADSSEQEGTSFRVTFQTVGKQEG